jgi:hypothetical protein
MMTSMPSGLSDAPGPKVRNQSSTATMIAINDSRNVRYTGKIAATIKPGPNPANSKGAVWETIFK